MSVRRSLYALGLLFVFAAPAAQAQQKPASATPPVAAPAPAAQTEPELPDVSDPLLTPPPPPVKVLASWQEAVRMMRDQSVQLRVARANVLVAQANARAALAPALPQLVAVGSVQHHLIKGTEQIVAPGPGGGTMTDNVTVPDPSTFWAASLNLTVPIFHPSNWYNYGSAKDALDASKLSDKEIEREAIANVADKIVSVVTAERLAEVSRASLKAALATVDLTKRRAALGASNTLDVLRVEGEASASRSQVVGATETLIQAREALGTALGRSEAWGVTPDIQLDALASDAQKYCRVDNDILNRSDVRAAQANYGVADRQVKSVDYAYLPTLDGVSSFSLLDPRSAINNRHETWTIGAVLNWTIYDGGLRGSQRDLAVANREAARANLDEAKRAASLQVTQALRNVKVAEANLAVSAKTREIDAETARLTKISFLNGSETSFDLVTTEAALRVAEVDLAVKEFDVMQAKIGALLALSSCSI
ncbi:MAG TPA: TolC family protein [Polyangiaceae bacterium]|jgi:outer membrane protein TolC